MRRPTKPPYFGTIINPIAFNVALQKLRCSGPQHLATAAGTPFIVKAHVPKKGNHIGQDCIWIKNGDKSIAYIYKDCWGHVTNYARTYIDSYTPMIQ